MKINFKIKVLPLAFLAVLSQTACEDTGIEIENKMVRSEYKCKAPKDNKYYLSFNFKGFSHSKKVVVREMANGKILQERPIMALTEAEGTERGNFTITTFLLVEKNQNYYQIIVDDRYLFTLSEIKINTNDAYHHRPVCKIELLTVNGDTHPHLSYTTLRKKDAVILPEATP